VQTAEAGSTNVLKLSGELRIHNADELRATLLDFVHLASHPVVDLSEVTECDTTGWQLLISAGRTAERLAKPFALAQLPEALQESGVSLGLTLPTTPLVPKLSPATRGDANGV